MNAMQMLVSQPWVERLGMTLLHFFWQGLVIAILYAAARRSVVRWAKWAACEPISRGKLRFVPSESEKKSPDAF